jgi:transposase
MKARKIVLAPATRRKLKLEARGAVDARYRTRCLIVLRSDEGWSDGRISEALDCSRSHVDRTVRRFASEGWSGLVDRREDNGIRKADERYIATVREILRKRPRDFGHRRTTWSKRLLIDTAAKLTGGVRVSKTTMGRVLRTLRARRGRAKPLGPCPWSKARKNRRMALIHRLIESLPPDEIALWEDEADIDLNPKIGSDWMLPGTQRQVPTPGKNVKRYFAACMEARTGRLRWVKSEHKNSGLFIQMLKKLLKVYADKKAIHLILDNFCIHTSRQTQRWLAEHGQKFRLHFLPPYCPDDNRIERKLWREVHANVTINHDRDDIETLCDDVVYYMMTQNRRAIDVAESRTAI